MVHFFFFLLYHFKKKLALLSCSWLINPSIQDFVQLHQSLGITNMYSILATTETSNKNFHCKSIEFTQFQWCMYTCVCFLKLWYHMTKICDMFA